MPVKTPYEDQRHDVETIGREARNARDRRRARDECMRIWNRRDVGRIERVENNAFWGWRLWLWSA